ncbi:MAG: LysR family transcriptional regulator [Pseudomonadota bacterium]
MDIKRLSYMVALAEQLNFARAAETVHLSQPALSRSIQTLEEELGMRLFDRDNRNVKLTTAGAVFLEQAKRLLFQMRNLERDMGLMRDGAFGNVAFGVGPLPTVTVLPPLIRALRRDHPGLALAISSNNFRPLLLHLRAEEIEFFVSDTRDIPAAADITITPVCRQHGPFLCRPGHPLLARPERRPSDMVAFGFASLLLPVSVKALLRQLLDLPPHAPLPIQLECSSMSVLKLMVREGDLILLATEAAAVEEIRAGHLVPLPFDGLPPMFAEIGVVELAGRTLSPGARLVLDQLRAIAADMPATTIYRDGAYQPAD